MSNDPTYPPLVVSANPRSYKAHYRSYNRQKFVTRTILGYDSFRDTVGLAADLAPAGFVLSGLETV